MPPGTTGTNRDKRERTSTTEIPAMVAARQKPLPAAVEQIQFESEQIKSFAPGARPSVGTTSGGTDNDVLKAFDSILAASCERKSPPKAESKASRFSFLNFVFSGKTKKKRKVKFRPTPPGQKLIKGVVVACLLILVQALFHLGCPVDLTLGHTHEVKLEPPFQLTTPLTNLQEELTALNKVKTINAGVFAINLDNGQYVESNGQEAFSAASMIKLPILVSFLMAVERGECSMDDILEIRQDLITSGSGFLQWKPVGTKISAKRAAELMITVSDNTATNMLIDKLGGFDHVNKDFHRWGLKKTKVNNWLVDIEGLNVTCPYDLVYLLGRVDHGELITPEHRAFMYEIMGNCKNRSLLVPGLGPGASIIHKTGTIGVMVGDAGIVTTSGGTRYAVAIQCARKRNDTHANNLIREMSRHIYATYVLQPPSAKAKEAAKAAKKLALAAKTEVAEADRQAAETEAAIEEQRIAVEMPKAKAGETKHRKRRKHRK